LTPRRTLSRLAAAALLAPLLLAAPGFAGAHDQPVAAQAWLTAWPIGIDMLVAVSTAAALYLRGVRATRNKKQTLGRARHWAFGGGLAAIALALATPLDVVAEHLFAIHQVQHLLLRGVAPMLLMLAVPAGPLVAGIPPPVRRRWLVPFLARPPVRTALRFLRRPIIGTVLYVGILYVWQVPEVHDAALLDTRLHYLMHVSMLASGLLFFWCVFDPRPAPWGTPFHERLIMLGAAIFANIPLGAATALKDSVLYEAYDRLGRWWGVAPMSDELLGGLVIWILASMMGLVAILLLVSLWSRTEERQESRRQQGFRLPHHAQPELNPDARPRPARRRMAWRLAIVPLAVGVAMLMLALWMSATHAPPHHSPEHLTS